MKTLALSGGDLVVSGSGHATISGSAKIIQELSLALGEMYGSDKYHPQSGSILPDFFGAPIDDNTQSLVESEVARVINAYIANQQTGVLQDNLNLRGSRFDATDVVVGVSSLSAQVSLDTIIVSVTLITAAGTTIDLTRAVQP